MKCKIKYKRIKYNVTLKDKISIIKIKSILYMKRILRRIKSLIPKNISLYLILTIIWIIFGICNYYFYLVSGYKKSILDIVIELKNSYFTTVIIAIILNIYNNNLDYNEKLIKQHDFYVDTMREFEKIFGNLIRNEKGKYFVFYNDICLRNTLEYIKTIKNEDIENFLAGKEFKNDLNELIEYISKIRSSLNIGKENNCVENYYIDDLNLQLKNLKENLDNFNFYLTEIDSMSYNMLQIIDVLREPWRKDLKNDIRILRILEKNNTNCIKDDYYYRMLVYGYDFGNKK